MGTPGSYINKRRPRRRRPRYRLWPGLVMLVLVVIVLIYQNGPLQSFGLFRPSLETGPEQTTTSDTSAPAETTVPEREVTPEPTPFPATTIELIGVGDIILHDAVIAGGRTGSGEAEYDYAPIFQYIRPIIQRADLAMLNFEGTLAGPPYTGFPLFSAPDEIADALFDAGFTVAWTANNHILDKGLSGLLRTTQVLRDKGFAVIGTRLDEEEQTSAIIDVNGIKVGLLAYTYETIGTESARGLNGIPIPEAALPLLDSFNPYRPNVFADDFAEMLDHVDRIRKEGAELVCLSLHWGEEYQTEPRPYQKQMARELADAGVDIIFGHHPHVLQPIEILQSEITGKHTVVFYSTSNLLANMLYTTHGTQGKAQDAIIARVIITRDEAGLQVEKAEYVPTHIVRVARGQGWQHLVVPVLPALNNPSAYQTSSADMQASLERIEKIMGGDRQDLIPVLQVGQ